MVSNQTQLLPLSVMSYRSYIPLKQQKQREVKLSALKNDTFQENLDQEPKRIFRTPIKYVEYQIPKPIQSQIQPQYTDITLLKEKAFEIFFDKLFCSDIDFRIFYFSYKDKLETKYKDNICNLSDKEKSVLAYYSMNGNYSINTLLRKGQKLSEKHIALKNALNLVLDKLPGYRGPVFREQDQCENFQDFQPGNTITIKQFWSSSPSLYALDKFRSKTGPSYIFTIQANNVKPISVVSIIPGEMETLFKSNSKFKVLEVKKENNDYKIRLEEVEE